MENKYSCFPGNQPDCQAPPLALDYVLDARILANNSPANGSDLNGVHYTLSSPTNLPVANQRLEFSVNRSAILIIPTYYTNLSGGLDVALSNFEPETVELSAHLAADPSISANSSLTFLPVGPPPTYELASETLTDNADADGSSRNQVLFELTYGGLPISSQLRLFITGQPTELVTTGDDGFYTASVTSSSPGEFTVRAEVENDRAVFSSRTVSFTPVVTYPRYLGQNTITAGGGPFIGLQPLLNSFDITADHIYRIDGIPQSIVIYNDCQLYYSGPYAFDYPSQTCNLSDPIVYTHLAANVLTPVLALRSGLGQNLHSSRYFYKPADISFIVQVYDEGPA